MVTAQEMGSKGGKAKSDAKTTAARKNASKPRGKWVTFVHFKVLGSDDKVHSGMYCQRGKMDLDLQRNGDMLGDLITEELLICNRAALPWKDLREFEGFQTRIV